MNKQLFAIFCLFLLSFDAMAARNMIKKHTFTLETNTGTSWIDAHPSSLDGNKYNIMNKKYGGNCWLAVDIAEDASCHNSNSIKYKFHAVDPSDEPFAAGSGEAWYYIEVQSGSAS